MNDGKEPISLVAIFSTSWGSTNTCATSRFLLVRAVKPLTVEELTAIRAQHAGAVIFDKRTQATARSH